MYYCSLKFILIVIVFNCQHLSSCEASDDKATSSKTNSIIMLCIGGGILVTMFLLIGVVFLLYFKVAKALRVPKPPVCLALKSNPFMATRDKIAAGSSITAESYPNLQCCDECNLCDNFDPLPPCFCDINEGL
ncbi:protein FAM24B [Desmodus rotundus]|uniref:protein FAM24B n=1 Tax=Desmodus rotundus TaxID=9430 RepID=UPI002380F02A|nr:protein FAM24B [Desmodus rotundus]